MRKNFVRTWYDKWENGAKYKHKVSTKKRMIKYIWKLGGEEKSSQKRKQFRVLEDEYEFIVHWGESSTGLKKKKKKSNTEQWKGQVVSLVLNRT